jgi:hypothetical protein
MNSLVAHDIPTYAIADANLVPISDYLTRLAPFLLPACF